MITWITENVAIGEYTDAVNEELLKKEKIDCILNLRGSGVEESSYDEIELCDWLDIHFYRVPIVETEHPKVTKIQLRTAAYMLEQLTQKYKRILVHCTAGIDRAPFVVAYWMMKRDVEIDESSILSEGDKVFWIARAYEIIKEKRPQIVEHLEWI